MTARRQKEASTLLRLCLQRGECGSLMAWSDSLRLLVSLSVLGLVENVAYFGKAPCSGEDWLDEVGSQLMTRISEYDEGSIGFSLLGLVRDPLRDHIERLALNVKRLQALRHRITEHAGGPRDGLSGSVLLGPSPGFGLTEEILDLVGDQPSEIGRYNEFSNGELSIEYSRLADEQRGILESIDEETQSRRADDAYAEGRRHDYSSAVEYWTRKLIQKQVLVDLINEIDTQDTR